jgi:hypothetical protein
VIDDYRELVIADLAHELALADERIGDLEADVRAYRDFVHVLLNRLALWRANPARAASRERKDLDDLRAQVQAALLGEVTPRAERAA